MQGSLIHERSSSSLRDRQALSLPYSRDYLCLLHAVPVLTWKPVAAPDAQNATCASDAQNATYTPDTQDTARTPNAENTARASDTEHTSCTIDTHDAEHASNTMEACVGGRRPSP